MGTQPSGADRALAALDAWPAAHAAAAVVGPAGVLATRGEIDRIFRLASVTKALFALAVLVAVEEEALSLDEQLAPHAFPGVTMRHLLSHASGIRPQQRTSICAPGVRRLYSNAGYGLAGDWLARATGMPAIEYFHQSVVGMLGLRDTALHGSPAYAATSTVADLSIVLGQLLAPGRLLNRATLDDATALAFPGLRGVVPGFGMHDPCDWSTGFELRSAKSPHWTGSRNSPATFGHFGQSGTMFWIDPAARLGLVALSDQQFGPWAARAWPALSDAVLEQFVS
ncbi:MAG: beta-lactamase family protein [Frankiaceae bacterium]|jgi:CubicO group peptidase (beta-lactamase class C family)|nr:beta-lactamase family protein [Frankiaceae bacterium]